MPKRFTDSEKWIDEWWGSLPNDYRMIWLYLVDSCSIAGIWKKDFRGLNFNCNTSITEEKFLEIFGSRVKNLGSSFFIPGFLRFQNPKGLKSNKPAVQSILRELKKNNLFETVVELFGNDYLTIDKSLRERERDRKGIGKDRKGIGKKGDMGGFEKFWNCYPRKVGKGSARKAWAKIKLENGLFEKILSAVEQQKVTDQWQKDGGQFIPHPATWLNAERWMDEKPEVPKTELEKFEEKLKKEGRL